MPTTAGATAAATTRAPAVARCTTTYATPLRIAACIALALVITYLPLPADALTPAALRLLALFTATIVALLLTNLPLAVVCAVALMAAVLTESLSCTAVDGRQVQCDACGFDGRDGAVDCGASLRESVFRTALSGFADEVNWLVFAAFHIGAAVEKTQLGRRLSLHLVRTFGRSILGLGYAIFLCELALAPLIPSNTARGGGILLPIVASISTTLGSSPSRHPRSRGGQFLMLCGAHANLLSASMYQTGMAANPLVSKQARHVFKSVDGAFDFSYVRWLMGSVVPGLVACAVLSVLLYHSSMGWSLRRGKRMEEGRASLLDEADTVDSGMTDDMDARTPILHRHSTLDIDDERNDDNNSIASSTASCAPSLNHIRATVTADLAIMGTLTLPELKLILILTTALALWITGAQTGLDPAQVAFCAVVTLLVGGVLTWDDVVHNAKCWDTFFWLGILICLAGQLRVMGVSGYGVALLRGALLMDAANLGPIPSTLLLSLLYFFSMYLFSSVTGHIVAFATPFLEAGRTLHAPPYLLTALIAYFSTLCGCLTTFSSGPIVIYYAQGFVGRGRWFAVGLAVSAVYVSVYFTVGMAWWKVLGWY